MNTDKISLLLEEQLRTLSHGIRIDIIKKLHRASHPLSFTELKNDVLTHYSSNINFSFHLNALKTSNLIRSTEDGYSLTFLGKKILNTITTIEDILNEENKAQMIRTSKYSKEPFKVEKIEEYLIREGNLDRSLAKIIVNETIQRLNKINIEYLTAPLMRELINAILIENGLEKIRHNLTRLGTPPYEVNKLFNDETMTPEHFLKKLGSDVSEQFLLLNLLPNHLADLYLSKEILLLNLNSWSIKPLSCALNMKSLIEKAKKENGTDFYNNVGLRGLTRLTLQVFDYLEQFFSFISGDIVLTDFDKCLFQYWEDFEVEFFVDLINSRILNLIKKITRYGAHLSLDFSLFSEARDGTLDYSLSKKLLAGLRLNQDCFLSHELPYLLLNVSNPPNLDNINDIHEKYLTSSDENGIIFYTDDKQGLINSFYIKINKGSSTEIPFNQLILDKILINLGSIASKANGNDDIFLELVKERLNAVFELFSFKTSFITKKLHLNKTWDLFINSFFGDINRISIEQAIRSISFHNFAGAIEQHCGIEFVRNENSTKFGMRILNEMNSLIREKREETNINYVLTQPHPFHDSKRNYETNSNQIKKNNTQCYSNFIKTTSSSSFYDNIKMHERLARFIDGGLLFHCLLNSDDLTLDEIINTLIRSKITTFTLNNGII